MGDSGRARTSPLLAVVAIALIVLPAAGVGYLVTTFLFAFSGGQNRMVGVINVGALIVVGLGVLVAVATWILRSAAAAIRWSAIVTGVGWVVAIVGEWLISFKLGA